MALSRAQRIRNMAEGLRKKGLKTKDPAKVLQAKKMLASISRGPKKASKRRGTKRNPSKKTAHIAASVGRVSKKRKAEMAASKSAAENAIALNARRERAAHNVRGASYGLAKLRARRAAAANIASTNFEGLGSGWDEIAKAEKAKLKPKRKKSKSKAKASSAKKSTSKRSSKKTRKGSKASKVSTKSKSKGKKSASRKGKRAAKGLSKTSKAKKSVTRLTASKSAVSTKGKRKGGKVSAKKKGRKAANRRRARKGYLPGFRSYGAKGHQGFGTGKLQGIVRKSLSTGWFDKKNHAHRGTEGGIGPRITKKNSAELRKQLRGRKLISTARRSLVTRSVYGRKKGDREGIKRVYVDRRYSYKLNPDRKDIANIAIMATTIAIGALAANVLDRAIATKGPSGSAHCYVGHDAAERILERPGAVRLGAQVGLGAVFLVGAYLARKHPKTSYSLTGAGIGCIVHPILQLGTTRALPLAFPVVTGGETTGRAGIGNRLAPDLQNVPQEALRLNRAKVDEAGLDYIGLQENLGDSYDYAGANYPFAQPVAGILAQGLVTTTPDPESNSRVSLSDNPSNVRPLAQATGVFGGCPSCGAVGISCGCALQGKALAEQYARQKAERDAEQRAVMENVSNGSGMLSPNAPQQSPLSGVVTIPFRGTDRPAAPKQNLAGRRTNI